ncbi:MAG: hypothetical protein H6Q90_6001 [Deltaproteobacteria bacterium]|nr:hypothetical protein [Deltaproteobacteria bacterium]
MTLVFCGQLVDLAALGVQPSSSQAENGLITAIVDLDELAAHPGIVKMSSGRDHRPRALAAVSGSFSMAGNAKEMRRPGSEGSGEDSAVAGVSGSGRPC